MDNPTRNANDHAIPYEGESPGAFTFLPPFSMKNMAAPRLAMMDTNPRSIKYFMTEIIV